MSALKLYAATGVNLPQIIRKAKEKTAKAAL